MRKSVKADEFNRMIPVILVQFMEFIEIPREQRYQKLQEFNNYLLQKQKQLNEESIQLGQDDLVTK